MSVVRIILTKFRRWLLSFADPFFLPLVLYRRMQPEALQSRRNTIANCVSLLSRTLPKLPVADNHFGTPNSRALVWPPCRAVALDVAVRSFVERDVCNLTAARTLWTIGENAVYIRESKYVPFPRMHE